MVVLLSESENNGGTLMPRVPIELRPLSLPRMSAGLQSTGLEQVGAGLADVATTFKNIQQSYETAEGGRIARETSAALQAGIKDAAIKYADPMEFEQAANDAMENAKKNAVETYRPGSRVGSYVSAQIADDIILRKQDVQILKHGKMREQAKGNWVLNKDSSVQQYADAEFDPEQRTRIAEDLGKELNRLQQTNLFDASDVAREKVDVSGKIAEIDIRRDFKVDPIGTIKKLDDNFYTKRLPPDKLEQIKNNLATSYRVAQNFIKQQTKDEQDDNFADMMVQARKPGGLTQQMIDQASTVGPDGKRKIDAQQAITLTRQLEATGGSGGVTYSNPGVLADLQFRLHQGRVSFDEIQRQQQNGQLTIGDSNALYSGLEATKARQRAEAREADRDKRDALRDKRDAVRDAHLFDVSNDLNYKRAEAYMKGALPNADRLDLDHQNRIMVGQAFVDFDTAARAVDKDGKPKYPPAELQKLAESVVEGTLNKMNYKENFARSKLLPGISTPQDIGEAVRKGRMSPGVAREQMGYLLELGISGNLSTNPAAPLQSNVTPPVKSRDEAAKERARAQGAK